jgi:hypothetical protein
MSAHDGWKVFSPPRKIQKAADLLAKRSRRCQDLAYFDGLPLSDQAHGANPETDREATDDRIRHGNGPLRG